MLLREREQRAKRKNWKRQTHFRAVFKGICWAATLVFLMCEEYLFREKRCERGKPSYSLGLRRPSRFFRTARALQGFPHLPQRWRGQLLGRGLWPCWFVGCGCHGVEDVIHLSGCDLAALLLRQRGRRGTSLTEWKNGIVWGGRVYACFSTARVCAILKGGGQ